MRERVLGHVRLEVWVLVVCDFDSESGRFGLDEAGAEVFEVLAELRGFERRRGDDDSLVRVDSQQVSHDGQDQQLGFAQFVCFVDHECVKSLEEALFVAQGLAQELVLGHENHPRACLDVEVRADDVPD